MYQAVFVMTPICFSFFQTMHIEKKPANQKFIYWFWLQGSFKYCISCRSLEQKMIDSVGSVFEALYMYIHEFGHAIKVLFESCLIFFCFVYRLNNIPMLLFFSLF